MGGEDRRMGTQDIRGWQGCALRRITGCPKAPNYEFWVAQPLSMHKNEFF